MEVVIPDRWMGEFTQFTQDMQPRYDWLRQQLYLAESWLDGHASWFKRLAATDHPDKPDGPWQLDVCIRFVLDADDPEHDGDFDNIICEMFDTLPLIPGDEGRCYPLTDWHDDFCHISDHPLCIRAHGWLTRVLVDRGNPSLGWENILRIGKIWIDAYLVFGKTFPLDPSIPATAALPTDRVVRFLGREGDNWRKALFAKRYSQPGPSSDELTCEQVARLDQMNTLLTDVETYFDTCGRWFHAARMKDGHDIPEQEDDGWTMNAGMTFVLNQRDPLFRVGGKNAIHASDRHIASCMIGKYKGKSNVRLNWNEYLHQTEHPLAHQHHCWLFHELYAYSSPRLGWQNILRIGSVKTSTRIRFAQSFPPSDRTTGWRHSSKSRNDAGRQVFRGSPLELPQLDKPFLPNIAQNMRRDDTSVGFDLAGSDTSVTQEKYRNYFQLLVDELWDGHKFTTARYGQSRSGCMFESENSRVYKFGTKFIPGGKVRVAIYMDCGDKTKNKQLFDRLLAEKDRIQGLIGQEMSWERRDNRRACRIAVYRDYDIAAEKEFLDDIRRWAVRQLLKFKWVFPAFVQKARE